jgi:hypothetical protein
MRRADRCAHSAWHCSHLSGESEHREHDRQSVKSNELLCGGRKLTPVFYKFRDHFAADVRWRRD